MFSRRLYVLVCVRGQCTLSYSIAAICVCNPKGVAWGPVTAPHCSNYCTSIPVNPILPAFAKVAPICIYRHSKPGVILVCYGGQPLVTITQVTTFHKGHLPLFRLPRTTKAVKLEALLARNENMVCPCIDRNLQTRLSYTSHAGIPNLLQYAARSLDL